MEAGSADAFETLGTIGIEEEYFIVDETGRPTSGTDELVYRSTPPPILEDRLDHELFKFVIEAQTPISESLDEADDTLRAIREALVEHANSHGFRIAAAGLHPTARWREQTHAEKPRYRAQLDRIQYPQHRNTTAGLHIHIGVDDGDRAVWIANELRWYLPALLALSANSPFWCGFDTGLQSARATIFESLPTTGLPTAFEGIDEFLTFERQLLRTDSINDRGEIWWDVRPHTDLGTVEVRTPDAQADPDRVLALVEFVYKLVMDLAERYTDGEPGTDIRYELLEENKWRALRYGREAEFFEPDGDGEVSLRTIVDRSTERLDLEKLPWLLEADSGAERQRELYESAGVDELCESLVL